jgi:hypothetical protein
VVNRTKYHKKYDYINGRINCSKPRGVKKL